MTDDEGYQLWRRGIAIGLSALVVTRAVDAVVSSEGQRQDLRDVAQMLREAIGEAEPATDELPERMQHRAYLEGLLGRPRDSA